MPLSHIIKKDTVVNRIMHYWVRRVLRLVELRGSTYDPAAVSIGGTSMALAFPFLLPRLIPPWIACLCAGSLS